MSTDTTAAYERILAAMQERYQSLTGFDSDAATDIGIRLRVLAGELAELYGQMEHLREQAFPQTSTGESLERHAALRGLARKEARPAEGTLRFSREIPSAQDIPIKAGVVCATRPEPQVQFVTSKTGVLPAGESHVDIPARAVDPGVAGNAVEGAVCLMVSAAQGITSVSNPTAFTGGADSESDEELRRRLLGGYRDVANGTNSAWYYEAAMACEGVVSANVVPRARGRGTVDVYIACAQASTQGSTAERLQQELNRQREVNVDIRVAGARRRYIDLTAHITVEDLVEYDHVSTQCVEAMRRYGDSLGVGEALLTARLGSRLLAVEGLYNMCVTAPTADLTPEPDEIIRPAAISVHRMVVA